MIHSELSCFSHKALSRSANDSLDRILSYLLLGYSPIQVYTNMLLTTLYTAQRLEEADILHLSRQVEACKQIFPNKICYTTYAGHGVASFTLPSFKRKLNRIIGFGMEGTASSEDLVEAEIAYSNLGLDTEVSICPLADETALKVLVERGYKANGFINNYARAITAEDLHYVPVPGVEMIRLPADRAHEFATVSVAGYIDGGRPVLLLDTLARMAVLREDTTLYFALVDGQMAGSAGMALIETSKGRVAHTYIDSTLPEYRGRGIQAALLKVRLRDARRKGYDLASCGARPGTGSARNIERAGFGLAYTKIHFGKGCKSK